MPVATTSMQKCKAGLHELTEANSMPRMIAGHNYVYCRACDKARKRGRGDYRKEEMAEGSKPADVPYWPYQLDRYEAKYSGAGKLNVIEAWWARRRPGTMPTLLLGLRELVEELNTALAEDKALARRWADTVIRVVNPAYESMKISDNYTFWAR